MTLLELLTMVFKHKKKILGIFLTIVASVTSCTLLQTPVYQARSTVLVKVARDASPRPGMNADNGSQSVTVSQDELISTEIQILNGQDLAERVIRTLQLSNIYPDLAKKPERKLAWDQAMQRFSRSLKVIGVRKSNVIAVSFQHNNPEIAARAVNLLIEAFKDKHLQLHSAPQSSFISSQLADFENKLKASENNLQQYQQKYNAFSLDEQRSLLLKQRTDFDSAYKIAYDNINETRKRIASLQSTMKSMANSTTRYTPNERERVLTDAKTKLLELQLKEQELRRKYTDSNRLVVDARRDVDMVNRFLKEQETMIAGKVKTGNPVYQNMEMDLFRAQADLNSQTAKAAALRDQLRQLDKDIAALDSSESKIQNLKRELAINEKNYRAYADRFEEARLTEVMNKLKLSNISVIQPAYVPVKPIKPKKTLNLVLGFLLGMVSALSCAYFAENMGQTFSDPESVEKYLGTTVLLTISDKEG